MKILYFGTYNPNYSRNRVLINGLRQNGVEVSECHSANHGPRAYLNLFFEYWRFRDKFDIMIVGFPGQEVMFLAKFLTRKPIIFDAFTSHYGGYILDRQRYPKRSWRARYYRFLDKYSCKLADLVLLDTRAHINFFVEEFGLPRTKFKRIFVGTNTDVFKPTEEERANEKFVVHFHGNYIPLQGVEYIIQAADLLKSEEVIFNLIGRGQTYKQTRELASKLNLTNINFLEPVPYERLPDYLNNADVCLGIFGNTPKTELVIPNKVYEALACRRAVITADTAAARELLVDGENALLVRRADPAELADKILRLKNSRALKEKLAAAGYLLFQNHLTEEKIGSELIKIINEAIVLSK